MKQHIFSSNFPSTERQQRILQQDDMGMSANCKVNRVVISTSIFITCKDDKKINFMDSTLEKILLTL